MPMGLGREAYILLNHILYLFRYAREKLNQPKHSKMLHSSLRACESVQIKLFHRLLNTINIRRKILNATNKQYSCLCGHVYFKNNKTQSTKDIHLKKEYSTINKLVPNSHNSSHGLIPNSNIVYSLSSDHRLVTLLDFKRVHSTHSDQHRQKVVIETSTPKIVIDKVLPVEDEVLSKKDLWWRKIEPYVKLARWDRPIGEMDFIDFLSLKKLVCLQHFFYVYKTIIRLALPSSGHITP